MPGQRLRGRPKAAEPTHVAFPSCFDIEPEVRDAFLAQLRQLIDDPAIEIIHAPGHSRPGAPPSRLKTEAFEAIEAAIKRIRDGSYGVCEITQKPIAKERLLAVPFTRYSAEAQKDLERNRHRSRTQAGIFGELGEEGGGKMADDGGGDD